MVEENYVKMFVLRLERIFVHISDFIFDGENGPYTEEDHSKSIKLLWIINSGIRNRFCKNILVIGLF